MAFFNAETETMDLGRQASRYLCRTQLIQIIISPNITASEPSNMKILGWTSYESFGDKESNNY